MVRRAIFVLIVALLLVLPLSSVADPQGLPTLYWGTSGDAVRTLQWRLFQWGYYQGSIDGIFGNSTAAAVRYFQSQNGLPVDGVVGPSTWSSLGLSGTVSPTPTPATPVATPVSATSSLGLLARLVAAEARGEPYTGQVAVAAVILNRVSDARFPKSVSGVVFQPHAFESVSNGLVWQRTPNAQETRAARDALSGWDPTYGSLFFWNPSKPVSWWIWTRQIALRIGSHVFAR